MRAIGFSTGALALGDFQRGLGLVRSHRLPAVELSALRESELRPLVEAVPGLALDGIRYVSVHAPSRLSALTDQEAVDLLLLLPEDWPVVVHPDAIRELAAWRRLGRRLCIENMDQRKPIGRTLPELESVFRQFPDAGFCLDLGHARQVDPTMGIALRLLRAFRERLRQIHVSGVDHSGRHHPIDFAVLHAFRQVGKWVPEDCPIILESPVAPDRIDHEVRMARSALPSLPFSEPEAPEHQRIRSAL